MKFLFNSRLALIVLALFAVSFTSCDDDDDEILGIDITNDGTLFLSSNTSGMVGVIDANDTPFELETFPAVGMDADGIFYDRSSGDLFQINRSDNNVVVYKDVIDDLDDPNGIDVRFTSTSDFSNGRGLTRINDNQFVVAQDGGDDLSNALVLYNYSRTNGFSRQRTINTDFNLWGIRSVDNELLAIVDNSDSLAVLSNDIFNGTDNSIADVMRYMRIDGITRTHGLIYDDEDDIMIFTDVADGGNDSDGAIIVVRNWTSVRNNATLTASDYTRIAGSNTTLGNPVDVAYDNDEDLIYVAERANEGGKLLVFDVDATGNVAPMMSVPFAGVSSLFLNRD